MNRTINEKNIPSISSKSQEQDQGWSDGKKALTYALVCFTAITANFGLGRALQSAADSMYEGGYFKDGVYFVDKPGFDAVFYCKDQGVHKEEASMDEMGEIGLSAENIGHPEACPELTSRDGKFWQEKINQLGLVGLIFE